MLFKLVTTTTFTRTIEMDSEEEALAYAKKQEAFAQQHNHHGEVTKVELLVKDEKLGWVSPACSNRSKVTWQLGCGHWIKAHAAPVDLQCDQCKK